MPELSTLLQLIEATADFCGVLERGVSTDASTTAITIDSYPARSNRTNVSNKTYEGNELYLTDAQGSSTVATSDMSATATTVTVASGASFAASAARPYVIGIDSELMLATLSSATFTILMRGWGGTRAAIHAIGATVYGPARTPNPNGIGAYVASTGVLTPSVTYNADPGSTVPYSIFFDGVGYFDLLTAVNKALRDLNHRSKFLLSLLPDGDMALNGISNWTASGSATVSKVADAVSAPGYRGPRVLRVLAGSTLQYAQSGTIKIDHTNAGNWLVQALVRAEVGTATLRPYDVTNGANITVSGTQTWTERGYGHIVLWFTLPSTCRALAFRLESTANADDTDWQYVAPYPVGARQLALPDWVTRKTQIIHPYVDMHWTDLRADTPDYWPLTGTEIDEDLGNPTNQTVLRLARAVDQPIWLDAYRPHDLMAGDAQTAFCDRDLVAAMAASYLAAKMKESTSGSVKTRWTQTYVAARKEARRISLERIPGPEMVYG